jgi:sulfate adenylyltransferase/3'-phosphoadenosine 5'-phosphosulfate synthase
MEKTMTDNRRAGFTVWFTGLSGAGKSTIAKELINQLHHRNTDRVELLDGDEARLHLSRGLGFSKEDRDTNIRRIGYVAKLLSRNGVAVLVAAISPYRALREEVRSQHERFIEVFVTAPLEALIQRDVKGLYKKALAGTITNFTGISDPYEPPERPEVILHTERESIELSVNKVLRALELLGYISTGKTNLSKQDEEELLQQLQSAGHNLPTHSTYEGVSVKEMIKSASAVDLPYNNGIDLLPPHGGTLISRFLPEAERQRVLDQLEQFPSLTIGQREWSDIELIATGGYSPLTGFVDHRAYRSIITHGRLSSGLAWTIPILLLVHDDERDAVRGGDEILLRDTNGKNLALLHVEDLFTVDKEELANAVWCTTDSAHPGVRALFEAGNHALAGAVDVIVLADDRPFASLRLTPAQTRSSFQQRGWKTVAAFQTRNPIHRAHEYIQKIALELVDGLLLHPLVGETKGDDIPAEIRIACYQVLLDAYFPEDRVLLSVMPAAMRYAGPSEAIHHAIIRQNYGCSHFIVGRDHAGVGSYYGTYDAQRIFDRYTRQELAIVPLRFEHTFFCRRCNGMASEKTCPHQTDERVILSGTKVRELLQLGLDLPEEYSRPEVVTVLRAAYKRQLVS